MGKAMPNAGVAKRVLGSRTDPSSGHTTFLRKPDGASSNKGPMAKLPAGIKNSKTVHQK